jgi:signal transduction histidine kinase
LQRLTEQQRDFVATASHELRTPVTVIYGLAATLHQNGHRLPEAQQQKLMERLVANAATLRSIVESLLDATMLEHGLTARADPVDLSALAQDAVDRLAPLLQMHDIELHVSPDAIVRGDRELLERVIDNLLTNAHRHTPAGTCVEVRVERQGEHVQVLVRDDGPGIPADVLPRVTERFVRAAPVSTRSTRGLGIGLALVAEILDVHGTTLEVASRHGHGPSFAWHMPHISTEPTATTVTSSPASR